MSVQHYRKSLWALQGGLFWRSREQNLSCLSMSLCREQVSLCSCPTLPAQFSFRLFCMNKKTFTFCFSFALACLDVGSGVVECLCKRGYSGVRCERWPYIICIFIFAAKAPILKLIYSSHVFSPLLRCAFGYYGNPMVHGGMCKPCNCKRNGLNMCDSLTGGDYLCNKEINNK